MTYQASLDAIIEEDNGEEEEWESEGDGADCNADADEEDACDVDRGEYEEGVPFDVFYDLPQTLSHFSHSHLCSKGESLICDLQGM